MSEYPLGALVRFTDRGVVASKDRGPATASGHINGEPIEVPHVYGPDDVYVPVWSARDNGREPTTVYVHTSNILSVEVHEQ
jgi:hypothetical protein